MFEFFLCSFFRGASRKFIIVCSIPNTTDKFSFSACELIQGLDCDSRGRRVPNLLFPSCDRNAILRDDIFATRPIVFDYEGGRHD